LEKSQKTISLFDNSHFFYKDFILDGIYLAFR